eukprot:CAMPEP_0182836664 /NCGR_PEP_ID=MMETSP0006_2-20121128/22238_1 /TAXON_ID=97485 /ORGANISM="Prymnesium parvum, Strain Texoma1" /LENGTH=65 /DNA_ID=CAMNT_0024965331 /DNA_START=402 /DNA_END=597 /DNA_ORIENTATION=-
MALRAPLQMFLIQLLPRHDSRGARQYFPSFLATNTPSIAFAAPSIAGATLPEFSSIMAAAVIPSA